MSNRDLVFNLYPPTTFDDAQELLDEWCAANPSAGSVHANHLWTALFSFVVMVGLGDPVGVRNVTRVTYARG